MTVHHLPAPPNDQELYGCFGPQCRWVLLCTSLAFVLTAATMPAFALRTPALWAFLAVLALNVLALALSSVNSLRTRRLTRQSHQVLLRAWQGATTPSVDLYLPTCGEPLEILANAYRAVAAVDWPGELTVWVLDDADRPEVAHMAAEFGFRYEVRPDRGRLKKAGDLNHALTRCGAEFIAILDADFAPRPDFLRHLVPYFADPAIGVVQSRQCSDTTAAMGWIERAAGAAQERFFWWIQALP
ncbi:cellulose synthase/poly-beta-1,6-N-acetylglucosamine synthase-like glycosyltransferase [Kitasatospora acidiphila]